MAVSIADAAIALLIDLAEQGEIDPWDVQVIDVIDRFLLTLSPNANTHDLSESGQAFLYAAMLVYLKAMALMQPQAAEEEQEGDPLTMAAADPIATWSARQLEEVLQPRAVPRLTRTRPITLKELIGHLQALESTLQEDPEPASKPLTPRLSRQQALAAITELAHPENLLETAAALESVLAQLWQQGIPHLPFEALVERFIGNGTDQSGSLGSATSPHRIQVFWALLLMASRSQVELQQEEFYGDLKIVPIRRDSPPHIPVPENN
ncbi:MAG: ScpA family protein [Cyanobacteriota bacterium]|nr:ScpA family protein [Cyanobacteriota bacterium]